MGIDANLCLDAMTPLAELCFCERTALSRLVRKKLQDGGSFKVILIFVFIQVQVAVWTGDLKEVSLCQTQLSGDVLP